MRIIEIEEMPKIKRHKMSCAEMQARFEEIMRRKIRVGKIVFEEHEYSSIVSARNTLATSAKRYGFPIMIMMRNNEVYFERLDMTEKTES